jgi:hypothetical protein
VTVVSIVNAAKQVPSDAEVIRAVTQGDEAALRTLLERGADPRSRRRDGASALLLAVRQGEEGLVGLLLDHGAAHDGPLPNPEDHVVLGDGYDPFDGFFNMGDDWNAALREAAEKSHQSMVRRLLLARYGGRGIAIRSHDVQSNEFFRAAAEGDEKKVRALLDRPEYRGRITMRTALQIAEQEGRIKVMRILVGPYRRSARRFLEEDGRR